VLVQQNEGAWVQHTFTVNHTLRLHHANVHLLGHGYAPVVKYTDKYGVSQTKVIPFLPVDQMQTAEGAIQFPDVNINPKTNQRDPDEQIGFEGRYLPTVTAGSVASTFPAENNPALFLTAYRGDLGLDVGTPGSIYTLDQGQIASGDLKNISGAQPHELKPGQTWTLPDGSKLQFLGTRPFATLAIRYDPTQEMVLVGAVLGLLGLMLSLAGHRRRVWFRALPGSTDSGGGTLLASGGLPRTDYPGFADEFHTLVKAAEEGTS
jgi:cytochrome c biogenesis protein